MHAVPPGHVVGGGDYAPLPTPDDDRLAPQRRVPVLLHRGKEGVEIEVGYDPVGRPGVHDDVPTTHEDMISEQMFVYK